MTINSFHGEFRWLSNFWPCGILYEGVQYPSTEHAYQAAKMLTQELKLEIAKLDSPGKTKRFVRGLVIRSDFHANKLQIMEDVLRLKFSNRKLAVKLILTKDRQLIEGNTWNDTFWGVCNGVGDNNLGKLLMKIRSELTLEG